MLGPQAVRREGKTECAELFEVQAGAEGPLAGACEDDDANIIVRRDGLDGFSELVSQGMRKSVHRLRSI